MKAVQINAYGGVEVLEIAENAPKPTPAKDQALVEVHAASINPIDWKIRIGYQKEDGWLDQLKFPLTLGVDLAGVISKIGDSVSDLQVGDEVYGAAGIFNGGSGSFAQFAVANVGNYAFKPKSVSFEEAAALPLIGSSAIQALEEHIKLKNGPPFAQGYGGAQQKILIHGGAGGIGHVAIQLAKALGAYVATTVSSDDMQFVKDLGADEAIDYKNQNFEEILKDYDAVFDNVGGDVAIKSFKVLKKGGVIVSMTGAPDPELAKEYGLTAIGQNTVTNTQHLNRLTELVDSGKIKVHVNRVFPQDQAKEAFKHLEEGHPRGKVVLEIKG